MDEEIERLIVSVRADTGAFERDVAVMRGTLEGPFAAGVDRAGRAIETSLSRAIRTGQLGFEDLRRVALAVLGDIADAAVKAGIESLGGQGSGSSRGSTGSAILSLVSALFSGSPGRATGGPVSPGRPFVVGERGPELFVPTSSGRVISGDARGGGRDVRVSITINAGERGAPQALAQSGRQIGRAVRAALSDLD